MLQVGACQEACHDAVCERCQAAAGLAQWVISYLSGSAQVSKVAVPAHKLCGGPSTLLEVVSSYVCIAETVLAISHTQHVGS